MAHRYLGYSDRIKIECWLRDSISVAEIARRIGCTRQTIYNEIKIGSYWHNCGFYDQRRYSADRSQHIHQIKQSAKGRPEKIGCHYAYAAYLEHLIKERGFSPAAALSMARRQSFSISICTSTLYRYIYSGLFSRISRRDLLYKHKCNSKRPVSRIVHPKYPSIEDLPPNILQRSDFGTWEMDLVVGKSQTRPVLLTLTERKARYELIFRLPDRRAASVCHLFDQLEKQHSNFKSIFKTLITDNGKEFLRYDDLRRSIYGGSRFDIYYCHSFAAWEKGTNENHNRMIRRFFPKGTSFEQISQAKITAVQRWMNNYPRKLLNWRTPAEVAADFCSSIPIAIVDEAAV